MGLHAASVSCVGAQLHPSYPKQMPVCVGVAPAHRDRQVVIQVSCLLPNHQVLALYCIVLFACSNYSCICPKQVLDGPVDTIWVEALNPVLDDNRTLCLSSGEAIPLRQGVNFIMEVRSVGCCVMRGTL